MTTHPERVVATVVQEPRRLVREGLARLLDGEGDVAVVAAVASGDDLLRRCEAGDVDAVVLELSDGVVDLVRRVRERCPGAAVVALHRGRRADHVRTAQEAGIDALVPYSSGAGPVLDALRSGIGTVEAVPDVDRRRLPSRSLLTPREREVLSHLAEGHTTAECAVALGVSRKTVDNHKQRIFTKLGVQNQAHAVALAHRIGALGGARSSSRSG